MNQNRLKRLPLYVCVQIAVLNQLTESHETWYVMLLWQFCVEYKTRSGRPAKIRCNFRFYGGN
jgi:hypothetical protein